MPWKVERCKKMRCLWSKSSPRAPKHLWPPLQAGRLSKESSELLPKNVNLIVGDVSCFLSMECRRMQERSCKAQVVLGIYHAHFESDSSGWWYSAPCGDQSLGWTRQVSCWWRFLVSACGKWEVVFPREASQTWKCHGWTVVPHGMVWWHLSQNGIIASVSINLCKKVSSVVGFHRTSAWVLSLKATLSLYQVESSHESYCKSL